MNRPQAKFSTGVTLLRGAGSSKVRPSDLLLLLVRRARWFWLGWLESKWAALRQWRARRAESRPAVAHRHAIETLEPRLLLSADLMGPGVEFAVHRTIDAPASVVPDVQNDGVLGIAQALAVSAAPTVTLSGPGSGVLVPLGNGYQLQLSATSAATSVAVSVSDGGRVVLTGLNASGPVGAVNLANADLQGAASFASSVGSLTLGQIRQSAITVIGSGEFSLRATSVSDTHLSARAANLSVAVTDWSASSAGASLIEAAGLKALSAAGSIGADLFLSGMASGYTLGNVTVGGAITGGLWSVHGRASGISAGSTAAAWRLNASSTLAQLLTKADASGDVAVGGLQVLQVGGSVRGLHLLVGANLGDDAALGGVGSNTDTFKPGTLARVRVVGDIVDSSLLVSIDPGDGVLGDGNDRQLGTPVQRIQELVVGGQLLGSTRIAAPQYPTSVNIGGKILNPAGVPQLGSTLPDTVAPVITSFILAPASDTGSAGDNTTTATTVILQGVAEADAALALRRNGNLLAISTAAADGSFSFTGVSLSLGSNAFELAATDAAGNTTLAGLNVMREAISDSNAPTLSAALQADTGKSSTDRITSNPTVAGSVADDIGVTQLLAALDAGQTPSFTDLIASMQPGGSFTLTRAQLDALAGGALADGVHSLRLIAKDAGGNASTPIDLVFTLDTQAPTGAGFGVASADALDGDDGQTGAALATLRGTAEPGASVTLGAQGLGTVASQTGGFQLPGVAFATGPNHLILTVTDAAGNSQDVARTVTRVAQVQADAVLTWVDITLKAIQRDVTDPPVATRNLALLSLAQYDTLAAIEGTPAYLVQRSVAGPVNAQAAVAAAAHRVLSLTYPAQRANFDTALATALAGIGDGQAKDTGIALGLSVADAILAVRSNDGSDAFVDYPGSTAVGEWRPTGPMFDMPDEPQWMSVTPFALGSPDALRAPPPPALDTAAYAAAVNEIKALGSANSTSRTTDQTQQALFWADGKGSTTPPGHWNQIAAQVAAAEGNSLSANARLFAQLNVALADAAIACWDSKYSYGLWRPETAIQDAELDDNTANVADEAWRPLLITPPHPEYVSGHASFSAAAAAILAATFSDDTAFSTTSATLPGVSRSFASFSQAMLEAGRSRIYGGIHYEFSNQAGQALGRQVAGAVLERFALTQDQQAPSVVISATPPASSANVTLVGQVLDNLSGVAGATASIDNGSSQPLTLDANGVFNITTTLATDGSADGSHTVTVQATDAAGNTSAGVARSFVLDTQAPTISLTSLADGETLTTASRLSGTADTSGAALTALSYRIDGGASRNLSFDAATGAFDSSIAFGPLGLGEHTLVLSARDAAGNTATLRRSVTVPALMPFTITDLTPDDGSGAVGVTQRPQLSFSRAVDPNTLNANSFYATGPDGSKLPATIVPAADGSFAWLFFSKPMPGGARITVHVDGNQIHAAADGSRVDADGDGTAGGLLSQSFTTVSTTVVSGTRLVGRVVDPGPDLEPMTFDDIRRGADGIIHTPDDVFLNPIAHARVCILGLEDQAVFTDANGLFELGAVPVGEVKLAIDGRTASNAPAGVFWPEMVMAAQLQPGIVNTLMGSMGALDERRANADRPEVYLPRIASSVLQAVSATQATVITVDDPTAAPALSEAQRQALTLTIQPGSAIDENGHVLDHVQIGIATVPPELVRDMLPPGVLQHSFDITIQAPGVATFAQPVQITFPNVFNAAAGTQLGILSFDHTTGMLVINGTGTVSVDGLTVVSDPDSGIKAPGWHGLAPPGGRSDPPGRPGARHDVDVQPDAVTAGLEDRLFVNDDGEFTLSFGNAAKRIDPSKGKRSPVNLRATPLVVEIRVEGPATEFLKGLPGTGKTPYRFELLPEQQKNIKVTVKNLLDKIKYIEQDKLFGTLITVKGWKSSDPGQLLIDHNTYIYRWLDAADGSLDDLVTPHRDGILEMADTINDGAGNVWRKRPVEHRSGPAMPTLEVEDSRNFAIGQPGSWLMFDPTEIKEVPGPGILETKLLVKTPEGRTAGTLKIRGQATPKIELNLDPAGLEVALAVIVADVGDPAYPGLFTHPGLFTPDEIALIDTPAEREAIAQEVIDGVKERFSAVSSGIQAGTGKYGINTYWISNTNLSRLGDSGEVGSAELVVKLFEKYRKVSRTVQNFLLSSVVLNQQYDANITISVDNHAEVFFMGEPHTLTRSQFTNALISTVAHEAAHTLGAIHSAQSLEPHVNEREIQNLALDGGIATDTFELSFLGQTTDRLNRIATEAQVTAALEALSTIGEGNIEAKNPFEGNYFFTFLNKLEGADLPNIEAVATGAMTATISNSSNGSFNTVKILSVPNGTQDIMSGGFLDIGGDQRFIPGISLETLMLGLHIDWSATDAQKAMASIVAHRLAGGAFGWFSQIGGDSASNLADIPGARLALIDSSGILVDGEVNVGDVSVDGLDRQYVETTLRIVSVGTEPVLLDGVAFDRNESAFSLTSGQVRQTLLPGETLNLTVRFDPMAEGVRPARLHFASNDANSPSSIDIVGRGISPFGSVSIDVPNNNAGGQVLSDGPGLLEHFVTITNTGADVLSINAIRIAEGGDSFGLRDLPAGLSPNDPLVLAPNQTFSFGLSFDPSVRGLLKGLVEVVSDDPDSPIITQSIVGTGIDDSSEKSDWGNDFVVVETLGQPSAQALRSVSNDAGDWSFFLPPDEAVHYAMFDPASGLISHSFDVTARTGESTELIGSSFEASEANDSDGDGLPDDIEFAIGSNAASRDTDRDGLDDFTEIQQGLDPLGGLGIPVGVVAATQLQGSAQAVAVGGSNDATVRLTAYVATAEQGLAVVDVSTFSAPALQTELDLPGLNSDVAVDAVRGLAALAAGSSGLHIVDVSNPAAPVLLRTIAFPDPVRAVEVRDGVAYLAAGLTVASVELATGEVLQTLQIDDSPLAQPLSTMAIDGDLLVLMDGDRLRAFGIADDGLTPRGTLDLEFPVPAFDSRIRASKLFVGGGVANIGSNQGITRGYSTVDVTDPDNLHLLSYADDTTLAGGSLAANGSGLVVAVDDLSRQVGAPKLLHLTSGADPADTGALLTRIDLGAAPTDLALAGGLAFVTLADGRLVVVNYVGFDTQGTAPEVSATVDADDVDPGTPGLQVLEGRSARIVATVQDDVQVGSVELLVNGQVVGKDLAFPFDLFATIPTVAEGGDTVVVQVRATDTGGNVGLSSPQTLAVVRDTVAPQLTSASLADGAQVYELPWVRLEFDEAIDMARLAASGVSLRGAGADGDFGTADDLAFAVRIEGRRADQVVMVLMDTALSPGGYELQINAHDKAGNPLAAPVVRRFSVASTVSLVVPDADPAQPGIQVIETRSVPVQASIRPGVSIGRAEWLVDGQVVSGANASPYQFLLQVPRAASAAGSLGLQLRITDPQGAVYASNELQLQVLADTASPVLTSISIAAGANLSFVQAIDLVFDEPIDAGRVTSSGVSLLQAGADAVLDTADDLVVPVHTELRNQGLNLRVVVDAALSAGAYRLRIDPAIVVDQVGNALAEAIVRHFSIVPSVAEAVRAARGTAADPTQRSANPGQEFGITVPFDPAGARAQFAVRDSGGTLYEGTVAPVRVDAGRGVAFFRVPGSAVSGDVHILRSATPFEPGTFRLQVVPDVTGIALQSISADGLSAVVVLRGAGFIEAQNSEYRIGPDVYLDTEAYAGPDASESQVTLNLPLSFGPIGPVVVKTDGGESAPFTLDVQLSAIEATALSGTPADPGVASANPGQAITLHGSGLTRQSDVVLRFVQPGGQPGWRLLNPIAAAGDGRSATLVVPDEANGVFGLRVFGSASETVLQVVPAVSGYSTISGIARFRLAGGGFVDGASTYRWSGASLVDAAAVGQPFVDSGNAGVRIDPPAFGFGDVVVETAGGRSAPLMLDLMHPDLGLLRDVAHHEGQTWVLTAGNAARIQQLDTASGQTLRTIDLGPDFGSTSLGAAGLQQLPAGMHLAGTAVPAGSLLLFNGTAANDRVVAIDPDSGAVIASLTLAQDYNTTAGVYDTASDRLYVVDRRQSVHRIVAIDTASGIEVGSFAAPFAGSEAGLAIDPSGGGLWYASNAATDAVELTRDGAELRRVSLRLKGIIDAEISGLAFDGDGRLLVASTQDVVYRVDTGFGPAQQRPTLFALSAPFLDGTPAQTDLPAVNVGQVIQLQGSRFGPGTAVLFDVVDDHGIGGTEAVAPLIVSADGSSLQVVVPERAVSGGVRVTNLGVRNLGYGNFGDAIYRRLTLDFTATSSVASLRFGDGGLFDGPSWGLDNVVVRNGASPVFADDFETGASTRWRTGTIDSAATGVFSRFAGRFSNAAQTLDLDALTAGEVYTLEFDLYLFDEWQGDSSGRHDVIEVAVDGQRMFSESFANGTLNSDSYATQSHNRSDPLMLQIVPTLTGTSGSGPTFDLLGSGFVEGSSTIEWGGQPLRDDDRYGNVLDVRHSFSSVRPTLLAKVPVTLALDGPIRVTTPGGFAEIAGRDFGAQPPSELSGIVATATAGVPADSGRASTNTGQSIILLGSGFTSQTWVRFQAVDDSGRPGTVTRTGIPSQGGTALTIVVPPWARSGAVQVLGAAGSVDLQVVPRLRAVGGALLEGQTLLVEGAGLVGPELAVEIDGVPAQVVSVQTTKASAANGLDQQLLTLVVPAGATAGELVLSTAGGSTAWSSVGQALRSIDSIASSGTPTQAGVASAVVGQTLSLRGIGLRDDDVVVFTTIDALGSLGERPLNPATIDADGRLLTVVVPNDAATGAVRLQREATGILLQIVPTIADVQRIGASGNQLLIGRNIVVSGSGYAEGDVAVLLGEHRVADLGPGGTLDSGLDVETRAGNDPALSATLSVVAPDDAPTGPIRIATLGGISAPLSLRFDRLEATASRGTPADASQASANPGQVIKVIGSGLRTTTLVMFETLWSQDARRETAVRPFAVDATGTEALVTVPEAVTGRVRIEGDVSGTELLLQIVPVLDQIVLSSQGGSPDYAELGVSDGTTMEVGLIGHGFVDGGRSVYRFGSEWVVDAGINTGPDVGRLFETTSGGQTVATVRVPPNAGGFSTVSVSTAGGTSNVFTITTGSLDGIDVVALSGTPADAGLPSANPGQLITLQGANLSPETVVLWRYLASEGQFVTWALRLSDVSPDGRSASLQVPVQANGVATLQVFGSPMQRIQVVPLLSRAEDADGLRLYGRGMVRGATTVLHDGVVQSFQNVVGPDEYGIDNAVIEVFDGFQMPRNGMITVSTPGGTASPLLLG